MRSSRRSRILAAFASILLACRAAAAPCDDVRSDAALLRAGVENCRQALGSRPEGSTCRVRSTFKLPDLPGLSDVDPSWKQKADWTLSTDEASKLADRLDGFAAQGGDACVAKRTVTNLEVSVDPPGVAFAPGQRFTLKAQVSVADGASPAGIVVTFEPEPGLELNPSNNFARKAGKKAGLPELARAVTDEAGVASIPGMVVRTADLVNVVVVVAIKRKVIVRVLRSAALTILAAAQQRETTVPVKGDDCAALREKAEAECAPVASTSCDDRMTCEDARINWKSLLPCQRARRDVIDKKCKQANDQAAYDEVTSRIRRCGDRVGGKECCPNWTQGQEKDDTCDNANACSGDDDCPGLNKKLREFNKCLSLRRKESDTCFEGFDEVGHAIQNDNVGNAMKKCRKLIALLIKLGKGPCTEDLTEPTK